MAALSINIILDLQSPTALALAKAVEERLAAPAVRKHVPFLSSKPQRYDLRQPLRHADIAIHIHVPVYAAVPWASVNIMLGNPTLWSKEWDPLINAYDYYMTEEDLPNTEQLAVELTKLFTTAVSKRPSHGVLHCPPILTVEDCPSISIVTPTYNRKKLMDIAFHNLLSTDYPADKMEWVVIEDSDVGVSDQLSTEKIVNFQMAHPQIKVKYIPIEGRMSIGQKRNIAIENCSNEIILCMDDDDHYPSTSFRRRVAWLLKGVNGANPTNDISVCTTIALYDLVRGVSAVNVPPWGMSLGKRISEATLTFRKSAWTERPFEDISIAEGESWIKGRENRCIEMPPQQIIVAFSHRSNASSRRIPPSDIKEIACFWGFPREYLIFIHELAGVEVEEDKKGAKKAKKA